MFTTTTKDDLPLIADWINDDIYHRGIVSPDFFLTGNGYLSFCFSDGKGPVLFVRSDREDDMLRLSIQFGPEDEVSRSRIVKAILLFYPVLAGRSKQDGMKGVVFNTLNSSLADFAKSALSFEAADNNDFVYRFQGV